LRGCEDTYCAQDFTTANINGSYIWTGGYYNSKPVYNNGTYNLWYSPVLTSYYWAVSGDVGDPQNQWVTSKDDALGCPDGAYVGEAGNMYEGECSSSSSSSSSTEVRSSSSESSPG